ncbi:S-layer homology domain-containing protein [Brevibacillus thermoruber]|uniref:S-layer homology domain-containing protein n=1 Tax=Brevibacillus thermoruber TaxID=33942 RepID=A0A9X3Z417_9BACL|nr:S-layer homology domain-containing protein [Brevibacillus thermoruber]MDA5109486.1 S-layer homology domain-containing protein [Brevibacillus thermoruber]
MTGYRTADGSYIFNPTAPALREDITVALVKLKGYDVARLANRSIIEAMFKDYAGISEAAKDYVAVAVENGLVSGYQDETFRPQASITRAEAATLLWRAYQYGNDNKGVGGGNQTTTTTPTPPVTQPTTPTTNPSTPSQPQQPSQAAKFSVDTLVGGMGQGDVDGPVSIAKINAVDSMVLDKEDNIFFLDQSKNKIRKFNKSNGRVETFKSVDSQFDGSFSKDGKVVYYDHNDFRAKKLTYSYASNRLYLLGFSFSNPWTDQIFELTSSAVSLSTYGLNNRQDYNYRFFRIDNNNNFIYGRGGNWTDSFIYSAAIGSESQLLASEKDATGVTFSRYDNVNDRPLDVIIADNNLYVLDTGNRTLTKIQLFPRKVETVVSFDNLTFNSVTAYNGMFYVSSGSTIYELNLNGKLSTFIAGKDLTYNDGNPINKISQLSFDSNGNVIVYDDDNKAIRRINLV